MGRERLVILSLVASLMLFGMFSSTLTTSSISRVAMKRDVIVSVSMTNESVTTTPVTTSTPSVLLPDLIPLAESSGEPGWGWVSFYACVHNQGEAAAGPSVFLFDGSSWWPYKDNWIEVVVEKEAGPLRIGEESCIHGDSIILGRVEVDIYDDVMESNEANNATFPPRPTDGGPYPTSTRTSTPAPPGTPTATPISSRFFPLLANNWVGRPIWVPTITPTTAPVPPPIEGLWSGSHSNQGRMFFRVDRNWYDEDEKRVYEFKISSLTTCGLVVTVNPHPEIRITSARFSYIGDSFTFSGQFTSSTAGRGNYAINGFGCSESGTWSATWQE